MPPGIPWRPDEGLVAEALKKRLGVVAHAAKDLGVHVSTFYDWLDARPNFKPILEGFRKQYTEQLCDDAEYVVNYCMKIHKEKPNVALNAAMYALNNQGKKRNYGHPDDKRDEERESVAVMNNLLDKLNENAKKDSKKASQDVQDD